MQPSSKWKVGHVVTEIVFEDIKSVSGVFARDSKSFSAKMEQQKPGGCVCEPPGVTYHNGDPLVDHRGGGVEAGRVFANIQGGPASRTDIRICVLDPTEGSVWRGESQTPVLPRMTRLTSEYSGLPWELGELDCRSQLSLPARTSHLTASFGFLMCKWQGCTRPSPSGLQKGLHHDRLGENEGL